MIDNSKIIWTLPKISANFSHPRQILLRIIRMSHKRSQS